MSAMDGRTCPPGMCKVRVDYKYNNKIFLPMIDHLWNLVVASPIDPHTPPEGLLG